MLQLAVLISGRGSNMMKLAEAIAADQLNARIAIVISNQHCAGITHAANLGIQTKIIETNRKVHISVEIFVVRIVLTLEKEKNFSLNFYVIMYFNICFLLKKNMS